MTELELKTEPVAWRVVTNNTALSFYSTYEDADHGAKNRLAYVKGCTSAVIEPLYGSPSQPEAILRGKLDLALYGDAKNRRETSMAVSAGEGVKGLSNSDIRRLWVECGGSKHLDPFEIPEKGFWLFVAEMEIYASKQASETVDLVARHEAFKAGWRTNATSEQTPEYLDGCERVDWLEFQARGLDDYLEAIKPEASHDD